MPRHESLTSTCWLPKTNFASPGSGIISARQMTLKPALGSDHGNHSRRVSNASGNDVSISSDQHAPRLARRISWHDDRRHDSGEQFWRLGTRVLAAGTRKMEWMDAYRSSVPLLRVHRGRLDGVLICFAHRSWRLAKNAASARD